MRKLILAGLIALSALAITSLPPAEADKPVSCAVVLCLPCPEGTRPLAKPPNCCTCVPFPQG